MSDNDKYFYCHVEGDTNIGLKRKANEDWLDTFVCENGLVAVVCDGMGGHVGGQIASHMAVDAIRQFLCSRYFSTPQEAIVEACHAANSAILDRAARQPELTGMGSTCVMLIVRDGKVYIGSVGDSRIYLVRSKTIRQLTKDQSYVQMLVDIGQITPEQAEHHPRKNEITNALGFSGMRPATVLDNPIAAKAGDCFILCSDGLSGMVSDQGIVRIAGNQTAMSQRDRVNALINKALENGGLDNITCQIVEFAITPPENNQQLTMKEYLQKYVKFCLPVIAAIMIVVGVICWIGNLSEKSTDKTGDDTLPAETADDTASSSGIRGNDTAESTFLISFLRAIGHKSERQGNCGNGTTSSLSPTSQTIELGDIEWSEKGTAIKGEKTNDGIKFYISQKKGTNPIVQTVKDALDLSTLHVETQKDNVVTITKPTKNKFSVSFNDSVYKGTMSLIFNDGKYKYELNVKNGTEPQD